MSMLEYYKWENFAVLYYDNEVGYCSSVVNDIQVKVIRENVLELTGRSSVRTLPEGHSSGKLNNFSTAYLCMSSAAQGCGDFPVPVLKFPK